MDNSKSLQVINKFYSEIKNKFNPIQASFTPRRYCFVRTYNEHTSIRTFDTRIDLELEAIQSQKLYPGWQITSVWDLYEGKELSFYWNFTLR